MRYLNLKLETLPREPLALYQAERLRALLEEINGKNPFYTKRLRALGAEAGDFKTLHILQKFSFTTKSELSEDQLENPPFGTNLTYQERAYTRYHQTSGTTGKPLRVLDTGES